MVRVVPRHEILSAEPDPITLERFPTKFGIELNSKLYNGRHLAKYLATGGQTVPHSRRELKHTEYQKIMRIGGRYRYKGDPRTKFHRDFATPKFRRKLAGHIEGKIEVQSRQAAALTAKLRKRLDQKLQLLETALKTPPHTVYHKNPSVLSTLHRRLKKLEATGNDPEAVFRFLSYE